MGAVDRLLLGRRIPPRVHDIHVVRLRERQARAAGLERNQEDRRLARTEPLDHLLAVARRTVQLHHRDTAPLQHAPNTSQKRRELAEHQRPVPARHDLIETIGDVLDLGRSHVRIRLIHQRGVERELTQTGDRRQHAHAIRLRIGQQIQDPRALAGQVLVVDVAVLLAELHAHDVDDLVGQIRGDLLLRAAQDEGGNVGGEAGGHARVAPLDGAAHLLREGVPPGQKPRAGQGQERPQVAQRVFDRRAAHRQAPGRIHVAQRPIRGCAGVLDGLRLVDDDAGEGDPAPLVGLEARQRVRGDHDVAVLHLRRDRRSPARRCFDNAANA